MEQLKVRKKDILITNTIIFLLLALLFLYLQHAYRHHLSPFSWVYFKKSFELFWYIILPIMVSMVLLWRHHVWAKRGYVLCATLVGFKVVEGLFIEFNKIIVVALFFYVVISYFLYQLLSHYLSLASINSNYTSNDLFSPLLRTVPCEIHKDDQVFNGVLTNWDSEGCFIHLRDSAGPIGMIDVKISFQGRDFLQRGEVVAHSTELTGIGIKFNQTPKDLKVFNWSEFMELVHELGFQPERLR